MSSKILHLRDLDTTAKRRHLLGPLYERCMAGPAGLVGLAELQKRTCVVNRDHNSNIDVNDLIRMCGLRWGDFSQQNIKFPNGCCVCMQSTSELVGKLQPCGHEVHAQCLRNFYEYRRRGLTDAAPTEQVTCPICYQPVYVTLEQLVNFPTVMPPEFHQSKLKRRDRSDDDDKPFWKAARFAS